MMNKKGTIILRDVMFMIIIFGGVMTLMSVFVLNMSTEYGNNALTNEYGLLGINSLGDTVTDNITTSVDIQRNATSGEGEGQDGAAIAIGTGAVGVGGAASIVLSVWKTPAIIQNSLIAMFGDGNVPYVITVIITTMIISLLSIILIFGIITALLKGGKM